MNGPKQKLVSVDEVSVSKLSVEIKTISVGRRQMSMALFRQLPREPLIDLEDKELRLNGMPWGRVNYHWDGCYHPPYGDFQNHEHIHVLWQRDSMLLQSPVSRSSFVVVDGQRLRSLEADCNTIVSVGALVCALTTEAEVVEHSDRKSLTVGDWTVEEAWERPLLQLLRNFRAPWAGKDQRKVIETKIGELCRSCGVLDVPTTDDEASTLYEGVSEALAAVLAANQHLRRLYDQRYKELHALEQLFISA